MNSMHTKIGTVTFYSNITIYLLNIPTGTPIMYNIEHLTVPQHPTPSGDEIKTTKRQNMDFTTDFSTVSLANLLHMRDIINEISDINDQDICIARGHNWTDLVNDLSAMRSYFIHLRQQIQLEIDTRVLAIDISTGVTPQLDLTVRLDKLP